MNPAEIIAEVARLGVALRVEGDNLVHRGPRGALGPELIAKLKEQKSAIIASYPPPRLRPPHYPSTAGNGLRLRPGRTAVNGRELRCMRLRMMDCGLARLLPKVTALRLPRNWIGCHRLADKMASNCGV